MKAEFVDPHPVLANQFPLPQTLNVYTTVSCGSVMKTQRIASRQDATSPNVTLLLRKEDKHKPETAT